MLSLKDIKFLMKNRRARDTQGLFVAEGVKLVMEAPAGSVEQVLVSKSFAEENPEIIEKLTALGGVMTSAEDGRFASVSDTRSPQGVLAVVRQPVFELDSALASFAPLAVILENVQDPGNAGTVMRTAEAAGASAVFLTGEDAADLFSPKTVRSTMGSVYRMPHFTSTETIPVIRMLADRGVTSYAAHLMGDGVYTDRDYRRGTAFVIGNESRGVRDETAAACGGRIRIPMSGRVESLNAAMAAGILMYEAQRQRRA